MLRRKLVPSLDEIDAQELRQEIIQLRNKLLSPVFINLQTENML
jgi:hypothetical protein